ncbi:conserved Plasmodium protein, unknown function [Plasmodium berghei]|uniref:Proteasome assembly chaperone 4 n=2 Tax=Plasmodium berghei TaxID=5821 RepID=A0A509AFM0_PLABA|nr:conserved Plasmodium protein, unknown function [Plasmodium berghei ANKA]CXI17163.1 conserved Plasmodium protein, unknown function [Plasmodium berghei]SCM19680.1 conserved Plasmodium protein, unknown function [Plasmodium berghei]SCN23424.1 conserved Plasmodium protein, unknown function [Plasmodium berghei]SCO59075.1 conserved Plasmodium protein, unknown function [Plasmodium berghei]SCO59706.1 conserved Plasmodium protein, unknown function [Plasmodium berghei]|eukprot:XP_034420588.1 conserved Plasmodium protein, unknown function [Plasmodium berghei ANKA]
MKREIMNEQSKLQNIEINGSGNQPKCYPSGELNGNSYFNNNTEYYINDIKEKKIIEKKNNGDIKRIQNGLTEACSIPKVIKKSFDINHDGELISYVYTLVFFKNYNIFFVTHNGKFASWIYTYNITMPFSLEHESEIILGERNYPYLEIFCTQFMKNNAQLLNYKSIMFAISLYKMAFDNTDILTQIFSNFKDMIKV